jgi:hypothetical protein
VSEQIDLGRVGDYLSAASAALRRWNQRLDTDAGTYVHAGRAAVDAIDSAIRVLHNARGRLTGQLREDDNERARRVDQMLAQRRGEACLHGEDARHRSVFGPPVFVGCGCTAVCCGVAELTAAAAADPTHGNSGPGGAR